MLFNPEWEVEVKADPMSVEGLIAWLKHQPADSSYVWDDCKGLCLIGLYGAAVGLGIKWHTFHTQLFNANKLFIASETPHTFGAALERARAAVQS